MTAALLLIVCMQQGYWYAGQEATVTLRWADGVQPVDAVWRWELKYGQIALVDGAFHLGEGKPSTLKITVPQVRVRTPMMLVWQLVSAANGKLIEQGAIDIHVFASDPLADAPRRLAHLSVAVMSKSPALLEAMNKTGMSVQVMDRASNLMSISADVIVIGPDTLPANPMFQQPLMDHATSGATVIVFRHADQPALLGIPLTERRLHRPVRLRPDHRLHHGLAPSDIDSLLDEPSTVLRVADADHGTPVIYEKPEEPKAKVVDALCLVRHTGKGRLVLCQIPLDGWSTDPRTRQLLSNMLEYAKAPVAASEANGRSKTDPSNAQPAAAEGATP